MSHSADSAARAEAAYHAMQADLAVTGFGLEPALRPLLARALDRKIALNRAFAQAQAAGLARGFQHFIATLGGIVHAPADA